MYTAALRATLLEWGDDPVRTLPHRIRAADNLCRVLGVKPDTHEALLCRALAANTRLNEELMVSC